MTFEKPNFEKNKDAQIEGLSSVKKQIEESLDKIQDTREAWEAAKELKDYITEKEEKLREDSISQY